MLEAAFKPFRYPGFMTKTETFLRRLAVSLLSLLISWQARAATYFLSPTGADSNPGTIDRPWRTLDRLQDALNASVIKAGDTIYFRGGDYILTDSVRKSYYSWNAAGTPLSQVTYRNYPKESPVIIYDKRLAPDPVTGSKTMLFLSGDHTVVDGLTFRQTEASRLVGMNGNLITDRAAIIQPLATWSAGIVVRNCVIDNFSGPGMFYQGENILVENLRLVNTGSHGFYISGRNGIFRNNFIDGWRGYRNPGGAAAYPLHFQYAEAVGNKAYGNVLMNGQAGGVVFSGGLSYNEVFNNVLINPGSRPDGSAIALTFFCEKGIAPGPGNKFFNNTIIGRSNTGVIDTRIGTPDGGPYCQTSSGGRPLAERVAIYNNIFHPSQPPAQTLTAVSTIHDNIFFNINGSAPPNNLLVNPMLANPLGATSLDAMLRGGSPAIDKAAAGSPAVDFAGTSRPQGARADIGAFEFVSGTAPVANAAPAKPRALRWR